TNLMQLTVDTSWWTRYRSDSQNPTSATRCRKHADIHQHDVWFERIGRVEGREAVGGFADDFEVRLGIEDDAEAGADKLLVVRDQDADHVASPSGTRPCGLKQCP